MYLALVRVNMIVYASEAFWNLGVDRCACPRGDLAVEEPLELRSVWVVAHIGAEGRCELEKAVWVRSGVPGEVLGLRWCDEGSVS